MKQLSLLTTIMFCSFMLNWKSASALEADSTGLPGDNFSLQGAIEMFKKAGSPEEFEKLINAESNNVNNLDLDGNGEVDYIRVIDKMDNDVHAFILQVMVSEKENQDVAVIELEKTGDNSAILQIVGDEDIYGEEIIVEATDGNNDENESQRSGGPSFDENYFPQVVVNVWTWPSVRFIYRPAYRPWVSPWSFRHYPGWWRPWRPAPWRVFHPLSVRHHSYCRIVKTHRVVAAHRFYKPYRATSVVVRTRYSPAVKNYRVTRTTRTVVGPRGGKIKTTKTRVRRGRRG